MYYAPHILQMKVTTPMSKDEFGRPIPGTGGKDWVDVCKCRCDDNSTKEFVSENGQVFRPNYHVVCEKNVTVKAGDEVRCVNGGVSGCVCCGESVRGRGKVYMVKNTNYLGYSELWM